MHAGAGLGKELRDSRVESASAHTHDRLHSRWGLLSIAVRVIKLTDPIHHTCPYDNNASVCTLYFQRTVMPRIDN